MRSNPVYLPQVYGALILEEYSHLFSRIRFMGDLCAAAKDSILKREDFLSVCEEWNIGLDTAGEIYNILLMDGVFHFE